MEGSREEVVQRRDGRPAVIGQCAVSGDRGILGIGACLVCILCMGGSIR